MDRFDAYIRLRICIQVLACNVLVHYGVSSAQCMDSVQVDALWNLQVWSWLIHTLNSTSLLFWLWQQNGKMWVCLSSRRSGQCLPEKFTEDLPCQKKFGTLLVKHPNPNSAPQICISLSWKPFLNLNFNKKDKNQKLTAKVNQACLQEFKNHPMVLCIFCPSLLPYLLLRVTHC